MGNEERDNNSNNITKNGTECAYGNDISVSARSNKQFIVLFLFYEPESSGRAPLLYVWFVLWSHILDQLVKWTDGHKHTHTHSGPAQIFTPKSGQHIELRASRFHGPNWTELNWVEVGNNYGNFLHVDQSQSRSHSRHGQSKLESDSELELELQLAIYMHMRRNALHSFNCRTAFVSNTK